MPQLPSLSVVTVNMANAVDLSGVAWQSRVDRLAAAIANAELVPDVISMTESAGWWVCRNGGPHAADYDVVDRLISDLRDRLDATYRVAYMVGTSGVVKNGIGVSICAYYTGDTLLLMRRAISFVFHSTVERPIGCSLGPDPSDKDRASGKVPATSLFTASFPSCRS